MGVRFSATDRLEFCRTKLTTLRFGRRVRVAASGVTREGVVVVTPSQIVSAPELDDAPVVVRLVESGAPGEERSAVPPDVVFLRAPDSVVGPTELGRAIELSHLPEPLVPPDSR